jgi:hypothetical protein
MNHPAPVATPDFAIPALVVAAGERASMRFLEFFAANVRNLHSAGPTIGPRKRYSGASKRLNPGLERIVVEPGTLDGTMPQTGPAGPRGQR